MTDDRLKAIEDSILRVERCIAGDDRMGQLGLISRLNNHARRIARIERWGLIVFGAYGMAAAFYRIYVDLWPHK